MERTLYTAVFSNPEYDGSFGGSIFLEANSGRMRACVFRINPDGTCGLDFWRAYRTRRDGEGQRQLECAMENSVSSGLPGFKKISFSRTAFSLR